MFVRRFAPRVLAALILVALGGGGCNHSSSPDKTAVNADSASREATRRQDGDDGTVTERAKVAKEPHPHGAYFPTIVLKTSLGELTIKLVPQAAPLTVNNFLTYVENGSYNQTIFH